MTEYELGEMMHAEAGHMWQASQMYFTIVSAYLIVGYLAGVQLTRAQVSVITAIYLLWVAGIFIGQLTAGANFMQLHKALSETGSLAVRHAGETFNLIAFGLVQLFGIIASLWFMWSVRHPKTE